MEMQKIPQAGFKLGVCGLLVYKENKFTKFDVSIKLADSLWKAKK
jgi:hypothetical protein